MSCNTESEGATRTRRYTIGRHGSPWTPHTARDRALDVLQLARTGVDPIDSERNARRAADGEDEDRAYFEFDAFVDCFIDKHVKASELRSLRDIEGTFARDLRPWFKGKSVRRITKADVKAMLAHVPERSRPAANKAHKWLNRMFTWGIKYNRLEDSPMYGLTKSFPEGKRDRVLDRSEIRNVVAALPALARVFQALVLLLLVTGSGFARWRHAVGGDRPRAGRVDHPGVTHEEQAPAPRASHAPDAVHPDGDLGRQHRPARAGPDHQRTDADLGLQQGEGGAGRGHRRDREVPCCSGMGLP